LDIPVFTLPVAPGRNLAVLVEAAVRNHLLRLNGYHAGEDLSARQRQLMN
jgi:HPr kinase/phosphorylase